MVLPILGALAAAAVPALSRRGLDLLGGVINGATDAGVKKVSDLIEQKTGIKVEQIAEEKLSEEQWVQLKEFELRNQELLLQQVQEEGAQDIDRMKLANEDRANARSLQQKALDSEDKFARRFIYIFAILLTLLTFGFIMWAAFLMEADFAPLRDLQGNLVLDSGGAPIMAGEMTEFSRAKLRIVDTVLGFLLGVTLAAIVQFFFGSSDGSSRKNKTIENFIETSRVEREADER